MKGLKSLREMRERRRERRKSTPSKPSPRRRKVTKGPSIAEMARAARGLKQIKKPLELADPKKTVCFYLAQMIKWLGYKKTGGCGCNETCDWMDSKGIDWLHRNVDVATTKLQHSATNAGHKAPRLAASGLIRVAIWRAKK